MEPWRIYHLRSMGVFPDRSIGAELLSTDDDRPNPRAMLPCCTCTAKPCIALLLPGTLAACTDTDVGLVI
jgi:hypothetical protein